MFEFLDFNDNGELDFGEAMFGASMAGAIGYGAGLSAAEEQAELSRKDSEDRYSYSSDHWSVFADDYDDDGDDDYYDDDDLEDDDGDDYDVDASDRYGYACNKDGVPLFPLVELIENDNEEAFDRYLESIRNKD